MVRTTAFTVKGTGSIPDWGTKIQPGPQHGQKKKKKQVEMEKVEDRVPEGGRIGDEEEVETGRELN